MRTLPLAGLFALLLVPAAPAAAQDTPRTLARDHDPVIVEGRCFPRLAGEKIAPLRLYASFDGACQPIPFQIDERTPEGRYALPEGSDPVRDDDGERLDGNDELCFLAADAGDRIAPEGLPEGVSRYHEVEVRDPLDGALAWVYLVQFGGSPPPPSPRDYVDLEIEDDGLVRWRGNTFLMDNELCKENASRSSSLRLRNRDGSWGRNVYDSSKARLHINYLFLELERDGLDMRMALGAYIDGPVRVVAQNVVEVYLAWGFWITCPGSLLYLYPDAMIGPTTVSVPVHLDEKEPSEYRLSYDLAGDLRGWYFFNEKNRNPVSIDGEMSALERQLDTALPAWNVACGPQGAVITRLELSEGLVRPGNRLYYSDDAGNADPPENHVGEWGQNGYLLDITGMKQGRYEATYICYYADRFAIGDERAYIAIRDHPLQTTVR